MNNLQIINSVSGKAEYVLLPIEAYEALKPQINKVLSDDYADFIVEDYVSNPVALARIEKNITQKELAAAMGVSQAYVSKIEGQETVSRRVLLNVKEALNMIQSQCF